MEINKNCKLFLTNVYLYDISACHYNILKKIGYNTSKIDFENKQKRNIEIGLIMRDNPRISKILRQTTDAIIDEYLFKNKIQDDEIVIRQYDGILITKPLNKTTDLYLPLELRAVFNTFIISIDRKMYLAYDGKETVLKGMPYRYEEMENFVGKLAKINFANKPAIFKSLEKIKREILESTNAFLFCIPAGEDQYIVNFNQYGEVRISKGMINILETSDINKQRYFDYYIEPFIKSIVIEFA